MPIYEYSCQKCGAHLEVLQKISDRPLTRHQKCGGRLAKQWSQTSFQLKGSGWYVTDYAGRKKENKEGGETTKSESAESKSKTTTTEAKGAKSSSAPASASGD